MNVEEFRALHAPPEDYVRQISFDPATARYWEEFNRAPDRRSPFERPLPGMRQFDFRLNMAELALFKQNGFVVSERHATHSFAEMFYRIWEDDLPVFVSSDAILQAWHRSYEMILEEMEETYLSEIVRQLIDGMAAQIPAASRLTGDGQLRESVRHADYLLAVARSLLAGQEVPSVLGQSQRVNFTLAAIKSEQLEPCFPLFDGPRAVDFSQFKVRGHYENSDRLRRYFQCMMWLGRTDLRIAGKNFQDSPCQPERDADPIELGTAVVLHWLLKESGNFELWRQMDRVIHVFVGWSDSMNFAQLDELLAVSGVKSLRELRDLSGLVALQNAVEQGRYGTQEIRGDYFVVPFGPEQRKLPRSFTVFGQRFIPDSWALSKVVFDDIFWTEDGVRRKVMRRVPSCLDVAFAVLGNDHVMPDLVHRISDTSPARHKFRDGFPYQHNLAALRRVIDAQEHSSWTSSIVMEWLHALRGLSEQNNQDVRYPEVFRTKAWAMKRLNTQLASWTQLRHDTLLYAKPSYTPMGVCCYPEGYVEPVPAFWLRLRMMVDRAARHLESLSLPDRFAVPVWRGQAVEMDFRPVQAAQIRFLNHFLVVVRWLERISLQQLAHQPVTWQDRDFINSLIEHHPQSYGTNERWFNGWYPSLFYRAHNRSLSFFHQNHGADRMDGLIVDVHTDAPCGNCDPPDPGSVLNQAVGYVNLMLIAVQRGSDFTIYAGPVFSHYEFEFVGSPVRWSDSEWRAALGWWMAGPPPPAPPARPDWRTVRGRRTPPPPPWTASFLVPANN